MSAEARAPVRTIWEQPAAVMARSRGRPPSSPLDAGYVQAGRIVGEIPANRTDVGANSVPLLRSGLAADGAYLGVRYGSGGGGNAPPPPVRNQSPAGEVTAEHADLDDGEAAATVRMRRPGVAVLSASYDPGWTATVNGRQRPVRMVAPAIVAVDVPAGTDHVVFRFHGYGDYPALLALSCLTLVVVAAGRWRRPGHRALVDG